MIRGAHYAKKWDRISKNSTGTRSSSSWIGENPKTYADNTAFNALLPVLRGRLRKAYLERLKWIHCTKLDTVHRKVMKTLRRVSMGLTVRRKTAKNLAVRRKNERILAVSRKKN